MTERNPERIAERQREKEVARDRLVKLAKNSPRLRRHIQEAIAAFNGQPENPPRSTPCTNCLRRRPTGWPIGKQLHRKSITAAFSTSMISPACAWNDRRSLPPHTVLFYGMFAKEKSWDYGWITSMVSARIPAGYEERLQDSFLQEWVKEQWKQSGQEEQQLPPDWLETVRGWRVAERKKDPMGLAARPLYLAAEKFSAWEKPLILTGRSMGPADTII